MQQLEETRSGSSNPENVVVVEADITNEDDRNALASNLISSLTASRCAR